MFKGGPPFISFYWNYFAFELVRLGQSQPASKQVSSSSSSMYVESTTIPCHGNDALEPPTTLKYVLSNPNQIPPL